MERRRPGSISNRKRISAQFGRSYGNSTIKKRSKDHNKNKLNESDEFKLLCKLFVPRNQNLLKRVSSKQLMEHLPVLIPDYPLSNYELHIFIALILNKFVISWYINKLNIDNMEFINEIYSNMCFIIKEIVRRSGDLDVIDIINQLVHQFNGHLKDFEILESRQEEFDQEVQEQEKEKEQEQELPNSIDKIIINSYTVSKHIMFQDGDLIYYRILCKNILNCLFDGSKNNPISSPIVEGLLISILSDLILYKIVNKVSDPEFILNRINLLLCKLKERKNNKNNGNKDKQSSILKKIPIIYNETVGFISNILMKSDNTKSLKYSNYLIYDSPIFKLFDIITNFSNRKPLLVGALLSLKSYVHGWKDTIEYLVRDKIQQYLKSSEINSDKNISSVVESIRIGLFEDDKEQQMEDNERAKENGIKENENMNEHEKLQQIMNNIKLNSVSFHINQSSIKTFSYHDLNKLLTIKSIDILIKELFPELTG
ncbi:hypothetical protein CAAN1_06S03994 [[Candida] anglica]|uniref:PXA domain-containing protein n=1 Tax=[Candida] anglica TaxID=148631 RepID=A0ABP0ELB2_9ASCO